MDVGANIGLGAQAEREAWDWVKSASTMVPPPDLREFHEANVGKYAKQFGPAGAMLGLNPDTQAAFEREVAIVDSMPPNIRRTLIDRGCLAEEDVLNGRRRLEALARVNAHRSMDSGSMTVGIYALACGDMIRTAPHFNAQDAVFAHFVEWWGGIGPAARRGSVPCGRPRYVRRVAGDSNSRPRIVSCADGLARSLSTSPWIPGVSPV